MIHDFQIAADDALSKHIRAVVRGVPGRGRLSRGKNVPAVDLEARRPGKAVVEFAAPLAFPPKDDRVRTHQEGAV